MHRGVTVVGAHCVSNCISERPTPYMWVSVYTLTIEWRLTFKGAETATLLLLKTRRLRFSLFNFPLQAQLTKLVCLVAPVKKIEPKDEEKPQKRRVKKDKDAPKKPMPPFFCYQKNRRDNLKNENPTWDNNQLIKVSLATACDCADKKAHVGGKRAGEHDLLRVRLSGTAPNFDSLWNLPTSLIHRPLIVILCDLDDVRRVEKPKWWAERTIQTGEWGQQKALRIRDEGL